MTKQIMVVAAAIALFSTTNGFAQDRGERGDRKPPAPEEVVKRLDTDKDGKISKAEAEKAPKGRMKEHFDDIDGNADGFIEATELKAAMDKRREHGERRKK